MPPLRVLILSDDALARAGLAAILNEQDGIEVAAQVAAPADLRDALELYAPDVVVWDWNGESVERLNELAEGSRVLALIRDDTAIHSLGSAPPRGILRRDASAAKIVTALQSIAQGLTVIEPDFLVQVAPARMLDEPPAEELTPREMQVLQLLARGLANKTIAQELGISEHTVKFHVNAILGKLGAQSRTDAVVRAMRLGLVTL